MVTSKKNFVAVVTAPRTSAMLGLSLSLTTWTDVSTEQSYIMNMTWHYELILISFRYFVCRALQLDPRAWLRMGNIGTSSPPHTTNIFALQLFIMGASQSFSSSPMVASLCWSWGVPGTSILIYSPLTRKILSSIMILDWYHHLKWCKNVHS